VPTLAEQVATLAGVAGSAVPLSSFPVQVPVPPGGALHHSVEAQSVSTWQATTQVPLLVSQVVPG